MVERNSELHRFLHAEIGSEETLDIVLFLFAHRHQSWSVEEVRDRLVIAGETSGASAIVTKRIELRLAKLEQQRIARRDARAWRYAEQNQYDLWISGLAAMSREDQAAASRLIYVRPHTGADAFADAFGARRSS